MKNDNLAKTPSWCPGCGSYGVSFAITQALKELKIKKNNVVVAYDIGCGGNMINVLDVCGVASLHGRSIPVASGIKALRHDLTVIAQAGDGGLLSEGLNHFIHAIQRNDPITLIVNNNYVFALTAGQQSSATPKGVRARSAQEVSKILPLSVVDIAATVGARFIARVTENDLKAMQKVIKKALQFDGFAVIEIIQPCKIWTKGFPETNFEKIAKPVKKRRELIGKQNLTGILYCEK